MAPTRRHRTQASTVVAKAQRSLAAASFALLLASAACGEERISDGSRVTIDDGASVIHVENSDRGVWEGRDPIPVQFVLEQVYGAELGPAEAVLAEPSSVAVDSESNLYVVDSGMKRIVSFGADGTLRWLTGREGQGPGELSGQSMSMAWDGRSTLYVTNWNNRRIDRWDLDGNHVDGWLLADIGIHGSASIRGFLTGRDLVLSQPIVGKVGVRIIVAATEPAPQKVTDFELDLEPKVDLPRPFSAPASVRAEGDSIYVGNVGTYTLGVYDRAGRLVRTVSRPASPLRLPQWVRGRDGRELLVASSLLAPPLVLPSGHWLVWAWWTSNGKDGRLAGRRLASSVDLFDPEGVFLVSLTTEGQSVPGIGRPELVGPDGRLYTVASEPYPQVRRYRVEIGQ